MPIHGTHDGVRPGNGAESIGGDGLQIVAFKVADNNYGIDIRSVREIRAWSATTALPNMPDYMRGVMNLRGTILPIVDLRARFGQGSTDAGAGHVIIVLAVGARLVGLLVDAVSDIVTVARDEIRPVPDIDGLRAGDCLNGLVTVNDQLVALIAAERIAASAALH